MRKELQLMQELVEAQRDLLMCHEHYPDQPERFDNCVNQVGDVFAQLLAHRRDQFNITDKVVHVTSDAIGIVTSIEYQPQDVLYHVQWNETTNHAHYKCELRRYDGDKKIGVVK